MVSSFFAEERKTSVHQKKVQHQRQNTYILSTKLLELFFSINRDQVQVQQTIRKYDQTISTTSNFYLSQRKLVNKNQNASALDSIRLEKYTGQQFYNTNAHLMNISDQDKLGWTTWLHNATVSLATIVPSNLSKFNQLGNDIRSQSHFQ